FLQGCPLRCIYCHNPESWNADAEEASIISVAEIIKLYEKNRSYYKKGGITISGGEPTMQLEFLLSLAEECKKQNIHLTIDTAAFYYNEKNKAIFEKLVDMIDLWLIDIKHINPNKYESITGNKNQHELDLIKCLESKGKLYWVRQVLVPGYTDDKDDLRALGAYISKLKYMDKFEILPYHNMAEFKYTNLNIPFRLKDVEPPTVDHVREAMIVIKEGFAKK
ncbi:MAG: radical SAM protein, partial [Mycoplasma sp.]